MRATNCILCTIILYAAWAPSCTSQTVYLDCKTADQQVTCLCKFASLTSNMLIANCSRTGLQALPEFDTEINNHLQAVDMSGTPYCASVTSDNRENLHIRNSDHTEYEVLCASKSHKI